MINLPQENKRMESQHTNSTPACTAGGVAITHKVFIFFGVRECFTFRTNQRLNPKLQKSYFFQRNKKNKYFFKQKQICNLERLFQTDYSKLRNLENLYENIEKQRNYHYEK